jgi:hypothetical protein
MQNAQRGAQKISGYSLRFGGAPRSIKHWLFWGLPA